MATHDLPILGASTVPDTSGDVFFEPIEIAIATTAANLSMLGVTMQFPTGSDIGLYGKFTIPQNYVGTPVLVIRGILDGNSGTVAFGLQQTGGIADNETSDVVFESEDIASFDSSTYSDEDVFEETITITPGSAYVAGDEVHFFFYRDDSVDTTAIELSLTGLFFRYQDA